ncbi:hypothetical protein OG233_27710 [Streptomyces sp. NBC_01218]|uniref:hypothetical protein n=1 Tax=unclassified Streptomyces TaxID=2593676 RepID=UPI0023B9C841|nr:MULTISPECIES: hypothetical protein [unclassified Streptomyces]WEH42995.1 hypothetical protein PZB77_27770 [Streptomyces sp. AM 2-1-1]WSQ54635.1 hypothetical protein OG233_27710 [Streptomyces sp. NBC_01218]
MSRTRAAALEALHDWAANFRTARRDALIAAAWQAGVTSVPALSEAARVSRPTVYAALRSQGIEPNHRANGPAVLDSGPLDIEGFTGQDETAEAEFDRALGRWKATRPHATSAEFCDEGTRLVALMDTTARYVDARDRLAREQVARAERDRLLRRVDQRWEALSTAPAWHAAHHAYVLAVGDAHAGVDAWRESAETALLRPFHCRTPLHEAVYGRIKAAGHPGLELVAADVDRTPARTAGWLRADLERNHERRRRLAAETLTL